MVAVVLATAGFAPGAATAATSSAVRPITACGDLVHGFTLPGAATHVTSAAVVAATGEDPEYCGVRG